TGWTVRPVAVREETFRPIATRAKGARTAAESLVAIAITRAKPPVTSQELRREATASVAKSIVRASLWAPPTTWTRTSGLRATKAAARRGSTPRQAAMRAVRAAMPRTERAATAFNAAMATPTGSQASG